MRTFDKHDTPVAIAHEATGLRWLAQAEPDGGAPVVPLLEVGRTMLRTRWLPSTTVSPLAAREFGEGLAITHAAGAPHFGCAPPGFDYPEGKMGRAPLPFISDAEAKDYEPPASAASLPPDSFSEAPAPATAPPGLTWGKFWAEYRLMPYLEGARNNGSVDEEGTRIIEKLCGRLQAGHFDHAQPSLVKKNEVARIHGDLWIGNVLWIPRADCDWVSSEFKPEWVIGVLIDPAAQGGHAECDLACLSVFGQSFMLEIYEGYNDVSELDPGWEERIGLHQLHILIVHAYLFGGGYGRDLVQTAANYL